MIDHSTNNTKYLHSSAFETLNSSRRATKMTPKALSMPTVMVCTMKAATQIAQEYTESFAMEDPLVHGECNARADDVENDL